MLRDKLRGYAEIGRIKALIDRQRNYAAFTNFFMLCYLVFEKVGFVWWYLCIIIPLWGLFAYIDAKYIMPREFDYLHRKSPVMKELLHGTNSTHTGRTISK